jgi:hypothetical protein
MYKIPILYSKPTFAKFLSIGHTLLDNANRRPMDTKIVDPFVFIPLHFISVLLSVYTFFVLSQLTIR